MREDETGQRASLSWHTTIFRRLLSVAEVPARLFKQKEGGWNHGQKDTTMSVSRDCISPELFEVLEKKAQASSISKNSWEGYALFLAYVREALERVPTPTDLEEMTVEDIDRVFSAEMAVLAGAVMTIFAQEGIEELTTYLSHVASRR